MVFDPAVAPRHQYFVCLAVVFCYGQVEARHHGAAAADGGQIGAPNRGGHPVEPEDRDPRRPHIADGGGDIFNVLVLPGPTEHGVLVEGVGDVFDGLELEPVPLDFFPQSDQVTHLPAALAGEVRRVELNAAHA